MMSQRRSEKKTVENTKKPQALLPSSKRNTRMVNLNKNDKTTLIDINTYKSSAAANKKATKQNNNVPAGASTSILQNSNVPGPSTSNLQKKRNQTSDSSDLLSNDNEEDEDRRVEIPAPGKKMSSNIQHQL